MCKSKNLFVKSVLALSLLSAHIAWAQTKIARPPQFVLFAFDGSYTNDVWQYSRNFTQAKKNAGIDVRFTFFINPAYLLTEDPASNHHYQAPNKNIPGTSNIGWGDNNVDVGVRVDHMNEAFNEGHEMGSHTVGHYNGENWSQAQWTSEFEQFDDILINFFKYNNMSPSPKGYSRLLFTKDIVGFRAPQLGFNDALYSVMHKFGFTYDTSQVSDDETYWPRKNNFGLWNFPLAQIKEPGGARRWVSMDYNFCYRDSARILAESPETLNLTFKMPNGKVIKNNDKECLNVITDAQKKEVKDNMIKLYRAYFDKNYYGNRAPVHIGHHFSSWMKAAYLEVFYEIASEVCSKPEVKCVTYKELQQFMDTQTSSQISELQAGSFDQFPRPKTIVSERHLDLAIKLKPNNESMDFILEGKDANLKRLTKRITFAGKTRTFNGTIKLSDLHKDLRSNESTVIRIAIKNGMKKEIATASYQITNAGTSEEKIVSDNIEDQWLKGDMAGAHKNDTKYILSPK